MNAVEIIEQKIEHYKKCYLKDYGLTYETLVAILQGLLADVKEGS